MTEIVSLLISFHRPVPARVQRVSVPKKEARLDCDGDIARRLLGFTRIRNATLYWRVATWDLVERSTAMAEHRKIDGLLKMTTIRRVYL